MPDPTSKFKKGTSDSYKLDAPDQYSYAPDIEVDKRGYFAPSHEIYKDATGVSKQYIVEQARLALDSGIPLKTVKNNLVAPFLEKHRQVRDTVTNPNLPDYPKPNQAERFLSGSGAIIEGTSSLGEAASGIIKDTGEELSKHGPIGKIAGLVPNVIGTIGEGVWKGIKEIGEAMQYPWML